MFAIGLLTKLFHEGVRIIDRMNWTGLGIVFPRGKWADVKKRPDLAKSGVYILVGYKGEDDDLPMVYIGQADGVGSRTRNEFLVRGGAWDGGPEERGTC
jgi:hypothetical protein